MKTQPSLQRAHALRVLTFALAVSFLWGCASLKPAAPEILTTDELIETLRHERIETLYYKIYPQNVKELMVRPGIVSQLIRAFDRGALSDHEKVAIVQCLERALEDSFVWVRTEAVWGVGLLGTTKSIPRVVSLLDDSDPKVVNETVLTLAKLTRMPNAPISNENMSAEERQKLVEFWKGWWDKVRPRSSL